MDNEVYSGIELPEMPFFVRLDGWAFHSLTERLKLQEPFDEFFAGCLSKAAAALFVPFNPVLAYIFSDEVSLLFTKATAFRRVEKLDSVLAALFSSNFSAAMEERFKELPPIAFDCRCIPVTKTQIVRYLVWRQAECFRNHNNAWAYWALRRAGRTPRRAAAELAGLKVRQLFELCAAHGINLDETPVWQRRGILLHWESYEKEGWDPVRKTKVRVSRRRVIERWDPPAFKSNEGKRAIEGLVG